MKNDEKYTEISNCVASLHNLENILTKLNNVVRKDIDSKYKTEIEFKIYKYNSQVQKLNKTIMNILNLKFDISSNKDLNVYLEKKSPVLKRAKLINNKMITFIIGVKDKDILDMDLNDVLDKVDELGIKAKKTLIANINKVYNSYKQISEIVHNCIVDIEEEDEDEMKTLNIFINKILLDEEFRNLQTETEIYNELVQIKNKFIEQINQIEENIKISKSEDEFRILEIEVDEKEKGISKLRDKNNVNEVELSKLELMIEQLIYDIDVIKNKNFITRMFLSKKFNALETEKHMSENFSNTLLHEISINLRQMDLFEAEIKNKISTFFSNNELTEIPMETFKRKLEVVKIYALENDYIRRLDEHKHELSTTEKKLLLSQKRFSESQLKCTKLMKDKKVNEKKEVKAISKTVDKKVLKKNESKVVETKVKNIKEVKVKKPVETKVKKTVIKDTPTKTKVKRKVLVAA